MFRHYLKSVVRLWYRTGERGTPGSGSLFAQLNLLGLTIGLFAFLVILHIVVYEWSYDRHLSDSDRLFRLTVKKYDKGELGMESARTWSGLPGVLKTSLPQVEACARFYKEECTLHYRERDIKFNRQYTLWADPEFMDLFGLEFILEADLGAMREPWGAIISESAARRFFGDDWHGENSPLGKTIYLNYSLGFNIVGVYRDIPSNTHLGADFIVSWATLVALAGPTFETGLPPEWNSAYVYVRLAANADPRDTERLINTVMAGSIPSLASREDRYEFDLQNVRDIHLRSGLNDEVQANGSSTLVYGLALAAVFILAIAWINYINLTTARAFDRVKEVGVRRVLGSSGLELALRFIIETFIAGALAAAIAWVMFYFISVPALQFTNLTDALDPLRDITPTLIFVVIVLTTSLAASIIHTVTFSRITLSDFVGGRAQVGHRSGQVRKTLIGVQFFAAVFLASMALAVHWQLKDLASRDLGMHAEHVLVIHSPRSMIGNDQRVQHFDSFQKRLLPLAGVSAVGASSCMPGADFLVRANSVRLIGGEQATSTFDVGWVEEGYVPALGIDLLAGRNFTPGGDEKNNVIINEAAARALGCNEVGDCLGTQVVVNNGEYHVVGILENTHYQGLQHAISPLVLLYGHDYEFGFFAVKVSGGDVAGLVDVVKHSWEEVYPQDPFDYFFLDSFFNEQYAREKDFGNLFFWLTAVAIVLACFGLVGLVSFAVFRRRKEIAIRKTLGAGDGSIVRLIGLDLSRPVIAACAITPWVAYYVIDRWLSTFAYAVDLRWWYLLIPCMIVAFLAAVSVLYQVLAASRLKPVDALMES